MLLAPALGLAALALTRLLLAFVARREAEEARATLPVGGAVLLVVAVTAAVLLLWHESVATTALLAAFWTAVLAVIFTVDLRVHYILDICTVPAALLAILAAALVGAPSLPAALLGGLLGGGIFAAFYGLGVLLFRQPALGLGDVKLAVLLGLILGAGYVMTAILVGVVLGGVVSLLLILFRRVRLTDAPAYGTYLALGGYVALLQATLAR